MESVPPKVIEVVGLTKRVDNGGEPLTILHENSFTVDAGESVAIVGASGSGKSTLLGLLAGLDLPSSGSVRLAGESLADLDEDARAALMARYREFVHVCPAQGEESYALPRCRDTDDQMFIDLAVQRRAVLVSKDARVIELARRLAPWGVAQVRPWATG